jgi:exopolysaccharide production protein ExoQ
MPSFIPLILCMTLILYFLWKDRQSKKSVSRAIWIPFIWMFFAGSRYASEWLNLRSPMFLSGSITEGSPVDRFVFTILIIAGLIVLFRRRVNWKKVFTQNSWIWLFFIFGAISCFLWSDYPLVSFKRLVKDLGNVVMVLVILTEDRPYLAFGIILRRLAFVLLPLSILFIKYYPDLGRAYHMGHPMFTGVATQKNGLGQLCFLTGMYFSWNLIFERKGLLISAHKIHYSIYLIILPMIAWLTYRANSATSTACLIITVSLFIVGSFSSIINSPKRILRLSIMSAALFFLMEYFFDIKNIIIVMLGRTPDLTTRMPMWKDLLAMVENPIFGFGFESFWLGDRQVKMMESWGVSSQAHNGYLDMYLNLGVIGLLFIMGWILSGIKNVNRYLDINYPVGLLRFSLIVTVALYNYTEVTFHGVSNMWIVFMIGIMNIPPVYDSSLKRNVRSSHQKTS